MKRGFFVCVTAVCGITPTGEHQTPSGKPFLFSRLYVRMHYAVETQVLHISAVYNKDF